VSPADWRACLEYAASAPTRVAALGVHPWYLDQILNEGDAAANEDEGDAGAHEDADAGYCRAGDGDTSSSTLTSGSRQELATKWLRRLRCLLLQHPGCLVGEIGLCKQARFLRTYRGGKAEALRLQRLAFEAQLRVACELGRAASVHCVNQHGVLLQVLRSLADDLLRARARQERRHLQGPNAGPRGDGEKGWRDAEGNNDDGNRHGDGDNQDSWPSCASTLPPAIALHSFTGTAHHVQELLGWEAGLPPKLRYQVSGAYDISDDSGIAGRGDESNKNDAIDDPSPPLLYFGFSHAVNAAMCISEKSLRRGREAVRAVPKERLLVESDVSDPSDVLGGTTGAIAYLAWALGGDEDGGDAHGASVGGGKNQRHSQKAPIERTSETTSSKGPASEHSLDSSLPPLLRIAQLTAANGIRFLKQHRSE
jgi:Tat protein secretion system quality control protein TatD with DNase activity